MPSTRERRRAAIWFCAYSSVNTVGRLQRVDAGMRVGRVRGPAVHHDFQLQATVVGRDDL